MPRRAISRRRNWKCLPGNASRSCRRTSPGPGGVRKARLCASRKCSRPASRPSWSSTRCAPGTIRFSTNSIRNCPRAGFSPSNRSAGGVCMTQPMFIVWRESVEALLVIGILQAWVRPTTPGQPAAAPCMDRRRAGPVAFGRAGRPDPAGRRGHAAGRPTNGSRRRWLWSPAC